MELLKKRIDKMFPTREAFAKELGVDPSQKFSTAEEIAKTINRSRSYVFKALKVGFTEHEWEMLNERINAN